jgi:Flp pilus assembly protein TadB
MVWEVVKFLLINGLVIAACVAGALLLWRWLEDRREARRTRERAFQQYAAGAKHQATYHDGSEH